MPWSLVLALVGLSTAGLLAIDRADELSAGGIRLYDNQLVWLLLGVFAAALTAWPSYRGLARWSHLLFALVLLSLVVVYWFPPVNGARRWISIGPIGVQPSEFAKVAFVLALARHLMYCRSHRNLRGLVVPLLFTLTPVLLILREPDLGTSLVFFPVLVGMLFAAGSRTGDLLRVALAGMLMAPVLWAEMSREQRSRVTALWEQNLPGERPTDDGYHLHQAKKLRSLGGVWGSAITGDTAAELASVHLPAAHSDFIFCVLGERFGLIGSAACLLLCAVVVWRGMAIATSTREPFGRLVAAGITLLFAVEIVINTAMSVGLAPVTGLSLPLVSYGGSGLLAHAVAIGLLINVALRPGFEVTNEPFRYVSHGNNHESHAWRSRERRQARIAMRSAEHATRRAQSAGPLP